MHEEKHTDELKRIAPELSELKREDGFTTPHTYFRELPDRVLARIAEEEKHTTRGWSWFQTLLKPRYALAFASVLLLIVAGVWLTRPYPQDMLATVSGDEALEYVLENLDAFSSEDLMSAGLLTEWDGSEISPLSDETLDEILEDGELLEELF